MASNLPPGVTESMIPGNRPEDGAWDNLYDWTNHILENAGLQGSDGQIEQITNALSEKIADVDRGGYMQGKQEAELDFHRMWDHDGGPVYFSRLPEFIQKDLLDRFRDEHDNYLRGRHKHGEKEMLTLLQFVEKKCADHDPNAVFEWYVEWNGMINWAPKLIQVFFYITDATTRPPQSAQPVVDPCFLKGDAWWFSLPNNDEPQGPFPSAQEAADAREVALRLVA